MLVYSSWGNWQRSVLKATPAKSLPASGSLATVDMKDFAGHEMRGLKIENGLTGGPHFAALIIQPP
jgi:hypothetical protein